MNKNPYKPFQNFVIRTPLYPVNFFKNLTGDKAVTDKTLRTLFQNPVIKEALFLASPPLYDELTKWKEGKVSDVKKQEKLKESFLKYLSRISSRCTPFGLFAGCASGKINNQTKIILDGPQNNSRHTRLDMNYLVALTQNLAKEPFIKKQLLFYPNTSIYNVGSQLRYVEYEYKSARRQHQITAVDNSEYLQKVLEASKNGLLLEEMSLLLIDDEITFEEAKNFVEELVNSQLLVSELEPSVSGNEFLSQIIEILTKLKNTETLTSILKDVERCLEELDRQIGNPIETYYEIINKLRTLKTDFDVKYLFQADLVIRPASTKLDKQITDTVLKGISLLNKITLPPEETYLNQFKDAFYERYETREMPLQTVLDVESGIGYKQNQNSEGINPLVDDIILPVQNNMAIREAKISPIDVVFQRKIIEAVTHNQYTIRITDKDFEKIEEVEFNLPSTISAMISLVKDNNGNNKIKLNSVGGSSGANLLGRFCHGDTQIEEIVKNIVCLETRAEEDKILAEIVHLPESRTGNILMRPTFRDFEIPYLAKSNVTKENQIPVEDLTISFVNNQIRLKSKTHNKEVVPRLTNAHNFSSNALPVYQFLCDMQTQNKKSYVGVNLGFFANEYDFIPRIEYNNLILSEATWNIKEKDIASLVKVIDNTDGFENELKRFKEEKNVLKYMLLAEGDNELLINFNNISSVKMLLNTVKNRPHFKLTEFLFNDEGVVKNAKNEEYYSNQIVLSFYNSQKVKNE